MIGEVDLSGVALIIVSLGTFITVCGGVYIAIRVNGVHNEVKTMNEGTIGSFAAEDETRRIELLDRPERTATEQRHIDQSPPAEAPQGEPR